VLAGLALYAYLGPGEEAAPAPRITTLKRDEITRIKLEHRGSPAIELEKIAGGWRLTAPLKTRADPYQVDHITDIVNATSKLQLPAGDISAFDLTPPPIRVTLNGQTFSFGRINDVTNEQYVAIGETVHLVAPHYSYGIPSDPVQLASRRILGENETPVAFDFGRHRIVREDGQWRPEGAFAAAKDAPLSQDDFNRWADEWRLTSALATAPHTGGRGGERLVVGFSNGGKVTMQILRRQPEFVLLRTDENMQYRFGVEVGRRLLDPGVVAAK
jgi:hypothetical protein